MIDNLRELNDKVNAFVNYAVKTACEQTSSGQYYVSVDNACRAAGMSLEDFLQFKDFIISELHTREELLDFDFDEKAMEFDLNCGLNYCPSYQWCDGDEGIFNCSFEEWLEKPAEPVSQPLSLTRMAEIAVDAIEALKCVSFDREWYSHVVDNLGFGTEEAVVFGVEDGLVLDDIILENDKMLKQKDGALDDLVVQFAKLWGMEAASARNDEKHYLEFEAFDSEELYNVFSEWAKEYYASNCDDTVEFFESKVKQLFYSDSLGEKEAPVVENDAKLKGQEEIVGTIVYHLTNSFSETVEFTNVNLFLAAYADALDTYGPNRCTATLFSDDLLTRYELAKLTYGCFCEPIEPFDEWKAKIEAAEKPALDKVIQSCEQLSKKADVIDINEYRSSKEER